MAAGGQHVLLLIIVALSIGLMLVRPRNIPEVYWVGSGATLLVLLRLISVRLAADAVAKGTDVYLFLTGMMLLSELARETGVFEWLSSVAVLGARGSSSRLFALVYAIGALVTITMSNDATAVVLTPAVLVSARRSRVNPLPLLFACAMIANAASFVLPISNPANLVVFRSGMPSLGRWLAAFLLPSVLSISATYGVLRWYFRRELEASIEPETGDTRLSDSGRLVVGGLGLVVVILLLASAYDRDLGLPTCLCALAVTGAVCVKRRTSPIPFFREISWATVALVAALFVLVDAVESVGALRVAQAALAHAQAIPAAAGALLTAFVVGTGNNLINNLPLGLMAGATLAQGHVHGLIANAVLIAVDLGPNLSVTGSLATILWLIALRTENLNVSFVEFLKVGALAMPAALFAGSAGLLLLHAMFAPL
ncbi:MAG: arsenic transporter [Acidobacteriaceae bacterium]